MKMNENDVELLLGGYRMTGAPPRLEQRVQASVAGWLLAARLALAAAGAASTLLDLAGFGYLSLAVDRMAGREAELQITII